MSVIIDLSKVTDISSPWGTVTDMSDEVGSIWSKKASGPPKVIKRAITGWPETTSCYTPYLTNSGIITLPNATKPYYLKANSIDAVTELSYVSSISAEWVGNVIPNNNGEAIAIMNGSPTPSFIYATEDIKTATNISGWTSYETPEPPNRGNYYKEKLFDSGKAFIFYSYGIMRTLDFKTGVWETLSDVSEKFQPYSFDYDEINQFGFCSPRENGTASGFEGALISGPNDTVIMKPMPESGHYTSTLTINNTIFCVNYFTNTIYKSLNRADSWSIHEKPEGSTRMYLCGNDYGEGILITYQGIYYTRDTFETVHRLYPSEGSDFVVSTTWRGYIDKKSRKALLYTQDRRAEAYIVDFS